MSNRATLFFIISMMTAPLGAEDSSAQRVAAIGERGGLGFSAARTLNHYSFDPNDSDDWDNAIISDEANGWIAVWRSYFAPGLENQKGSYLVYSRYEVLERRWTVGQPLNPSAGFEMTEDLAPALIRCSDGRLVCLWQTNEASFGEAGGVADSDIALSIYDEDAPAWSVPKKMNSLAGKDLGDDFRVEAAEGGLGRMVAIWMTSSDDLGDAGGDIDLHFAASDDNGASWSAQRPLNDWFASDSGDDWLPTIATDRSGVWLATWASNDARTGLGSADFDILFSLSADGGHSWSLPALVNTDGAFDNWDDGALDVSLILYRGPQIATDSNGVWVVVWGSYAPVGGGPVTEDTDILFARSTDLGANWSPPAPINSNALADHVGPPGFRSDIDPRLIYDGIGNFICIWETQGFTPPSSNEVDLAISRSADGGITWSPMQPLNSNHATDTGWDFAPSIAADGKGNYAAIWCTTDPAFGGGGPGPFAESDIAYSFSCNLDPPPQKNILGYLLGLSPSPAGLDINCDGQVDAADVLLSVP